MDGCPLARLWKSKQFVMILSGGLDPKLKLHEGPSKSSVATSQTELCTQSTKDALSRSTFDECALNFGRWSSSWLGQPKQQGIMEQCRVLQDKLAATASSPPKKKRKNGDSLLQLQDLEMDELLDGLDTDDSTVPDSEKQQVKDCEIKNGLNKEGNPTVLEVEDCPKFWEFVQACRKEHGNTSAKAQRWAEHRASGAATPVSNPTLQSLEAKPIHRDTEWVKKQEMLLEKTEEMHRCQIHNHS